MTDPADLRRLLAGEAPIPAPAWLAAQATVDYEAELVSLVGSAAAPGRVAVEVAASAPARDQVAGQL